MYIQSFLFLQMHANHEMRLGLKHKANNSCNGVPCTLKSDAKWVPDQVSICDELLG